MSGRYYLRHGIHVYRPPEPPKPRVWPYVLALAVMIGALALALPYLLN